MALITGNENDNFLPGTAESDRIRGLGGNDRIEGRDGNDILEGGNGRDTIYGGTGRDILIGGLGRDLMYGGPGNDTYRFDDRDAGDATAGPLSDVIFDFSAGDVLDLMAVDIFYFYGGGPDPARGSFSTWQAGGSTFVSWNTFGAVHDVELRGFTGDPFRQIVWYEDDYLANVNTTGRIASGQTRAGNIEVAEDADWFRITLREDRLYTFDLRGAADGGGTLPEPYVNLYDADGNSVAGSYEELQFLAESAGTYFVEATGFGATGTYRLAVTSRAYVDDYAGDATTTGRIAPGQTRDGEFGIPYDQDWFRIRLTEGETYAISLQSPAGLPDAHVRLIDSDGNEIDFNHDVLTHTASADGTYFIAVEDGFGFTGPYELSVEQLIA